MLNLNVGSAVEIDGRSCIVTKVGQRGHAVYGPYDQLDPGNYIIEFHLSIAEPRSKTSDFLCAVIDVAYDVGESRAARKEIYVSQLHAGRSKYTLSFEVKKRSRFEYRVWVNGSISLMIDDHRRLIRVPDEENSLQTLLSQNKFPEEEGNDIPFFRENLAVFRGYYEQGVCVNIIRDTVVLTVKGISLFARSQDDLTFIGEIFYEGAYNFSVGRDTCVIDIGMNAGLASLTFAQRSEVVEVHAFEPFRNTFDRAIDNIGLNPALAGKINPRNYGLSDRDEEGSVPVVQHADSGAMSTIGLADGMPMHVHLKDAGTELKPIVEAAAALQRAIVVKVDCEGSEFAIFRSIAKAGLLPHISAFMVEWHAVFQDLDQRDLITPLRDNGFIIFDRSPPTGNGFFYAARIA